ncbi:MAG: mannose-6-phosphate isomerase, class I, partial [Nakamurella sp.]
MSNPVRPYAWGSRTAIAELQGRPTPTDQPEAELWMGAHPDDPSDVVVDGHRRPLDKVITDDPLASLGADVVLAHGPRLPFLLKILAATSPLSLQVHSTNEQAEAGFADEEARGIPRTAPHRMYRDTHHKPELVCALTPFRALCGFRRVQDTIRLLRHLRVPQLDPMLDTLTGRLPSDGLAAAVPSLLSAEPASRTLLLAEVLKACRRNTAADGEHSEFIGEYRTAV